MALKPALEKRLAEFGQQDLLAFWDELSEAERRGLAEQIAQVDFSTIADLTKRQQQAADFAALAARAETPQAFRLGASDNQFTPAQAREAGAAALARGEVGAILVAGGQGTRLGFPHPKGMFAIGPVSRAPLFQVLFEKLLAIGRRHKTRLPLYLMTSPATHAETVAYLGEKQRFGLAADDVHFFSQAQMPAVEIGTGRLLLEDKARLALSPDGHGGMLAALAKSGGLADMARRGLRRLFYFQVDNPLTTVCDAEFIGYHMLARSEMTLQVVAKRYPLERVGNVVSVDGRLQIIEYSDLPESVAVLKNPDGSLRFWAGSIAVHLFDLAFLERMQHDAGGLPFHIARKKVAHIDSAGNRIEPQSPNAIKFERFIFDLLPHAARSTIVEIDPAIGFAPVKNAPGEKQDTAATAQAALIALHTGWLREAGAVVAAGTPVEISPLFALDATDLAGKLAPGLPVTQPTCFS
ncbi:MAG TPA: UTP--glucose-1-phosphate uridylyltransferase [Pirellulales bacterium]|jgi:UDP-N-acetylglucosamine/UDP-N-acetylgalactosamine diphosphorylase|nr:UTP--glucose-1-phosphate uridylyltransferase [Pirellulales bacterium]